MTTVPLRERIAELVDPMPWNGWRVLFDRSARNAELESDLEARERIFAGTRAYADSIHAERKQKSLELADKLISLAADGVVKLLKEAPAPASLGTRAGLAKYLEWHRTVQGLDLSTIGLRQVGPSPEDYRPVSVPGLASQSRIASTNDNEDDPQP